MLKRRKHKAESMWRTGIYLGRAERTHEHLIGTSGGIFKTRTVKRLPEVQRGNAEELREMCGSPWHPRLALRPGRRKKKEGGAPPLAIPVGNDGAQKSAEAQGAKEERTTAGGEGAEQPAQPAPPPAAPQQDQGPQVFEMTPGAVVAVENRAAG